MLRVCQECPSRESELKARFLELTSYTELLSSALPSIIWLDAQSHLLRHVLQRGSRGSERTRARGLIMGMQQKTAQIQGLKLQTGIH